MRAAASRSKDVHVVSSHRPPDCATVRRATPAPPSWTPADWHFTTTNMTGRHPGPKQKLQAGYRALSLQWTSYVPLVKFLPIGHRGPVWWILYFSSSSVISCAFSALYVSSTFGHHLLGYPYGKFCFFCGFHCWASRWEKSHTQSLSQSPSLFDVLGTKAFTPKHSVIACYLSINCTMIRPTTAYNSWCVSTLFN